jgi:hypothetical protein
MPVAKDVEYGPWQVTGLLMVGVTLWMSSIDNIPPEAYGFYLMFSRATILAVMYVEREYKGMIAVLTGVPSVSCSVIRCTPIGHGSEKSNYGTPNRSLRNKASRSIRVKPNSQESRELRSWGRP